MLGHVLTMRETMERKKNSKRSNKFCCLRDLHLNVDIGRLIKDMKYCWFVCSKERKFQASHKEDDWEF